MDKNSWPILFLKQFWPFWFLILLTIFKLIPFYYLLIIYLLFCLYHKITSTTEIIYTKNSPMEEIIKKSNIPSLKFIPSFLFPITPLQFINLSRTKTTPKHKINVKRKYIGNNGVCLDWIQYEGIETKNKPILIIFPGLTGCIDDAYVINIANECIINCNFNVCIYQMRLLNEKVKINKRYLFLIDDIDEALDDIINEYGSKINIYGVGFSYGANQLVKYLGQKNNKVKKIKAGISISNPYEFIISARLGHNKIYNRMLLMFLQKVVKKTKKQLEQLNLNLDTDLLLTTNQITDFDEYYTSYLFGFRGADDYYRNISSVYDMKNVDVPLLCISAKDDQICFEEGIPFEEIKLNKNIALLLTSYGTHSCFIESNGLFGLKVKQWITKPVTQFLKTVENML